MTLKEIGLFIQKTRKAQGLTQLELARLTCVGRRFILELESGKESIHFGKALKVMSALGIGINLEEPMGV